MSDGSVTVDIPILARLSLDIAGLREDVADLRRAVQPTRMWWTLREACEWKGVGYETTRRHRYLQPGFGEAHTVGRRRVYHISVVEPWTHKTDDELQREFRASQKPA